MPSRQSEKLGIQKLAKLLQKASSQPYQELELKLGECNDQGRFMSGLDPASFEKLMHWFSSSKCWTSVENSNQIDYNFDNNIRGSGALWDEKLSFIRKKTHNHLDFSSNFSRFCVRASLKTEIPKDLQVGRDIGTYRSVRVKKRVSFVFDCWSFDLTSVWAGIDPVHALTTDLPQDCLNFTLPINFNKAADSLELEIEYRPKSLQTLDVTLSEAYAESFLQKARDVLEFLKCGNVEFTLNKETIMDE